MLFAELLRTVDPKEMLYRLLVAVPDADEASYLQAFQRLLALTPQAPDAPIQIQLLQVTKNPCDSEDGDQIEVCAYNPVTKQGFGCDFIPWAVWLGMEVEPQTLAAFSPETIAAQVLFEMTFHGFTEDAPAQFEAETAEMIQRAMAETEGCAARNNAEYRAWLETTATEAMEE